VVKSSVVRRENGGLAVPPGTPASGGATRPAIYDAGASVKHLRFLDNPQFRGFINQCFICGFSLLQIWNLRRWPFYGGAK
jgi:hypothetical protein